MPICITCSTPVKNLYTTYSKADDRSLGKGVRLTQCPNCKRFADKYVEHDYVVLFIDLVLIKPQVYRHLLFNRLWNPNDALDPFIIRLGILLILFDVYITWARIERTNSPTSTSTSTSSFSPSTPNRISNASIITQYLFFLTLNVVATVVQHGTVRILARILVKPRQDTVILGGSPKTQVQNQSQHQHQHHATNANGLHHVRSNSSPGKGRIDHSTTVPSATLPIQGMASSASMTALNETTPRQSMSLSSGAVHGVGQQQPQQQPHKGPSQQTEALTHAYQQMHNHSNSNSTSIHYRSRSESGPGGQASPSAISTALLVSSCTKLFPILLVIWPTSGTSSQSSGDQDVDASSWAPFARRATSYIGWIVLLNNIEALLILLQCGYVAATALAVAGLLSRWLVEGWILSAAGLVRELEGPIGDAISVCRWVVGGG